MPQTFDLLNKFVNKYQHEVLLTRENLLTSVSEKSSPIRTELESYLSERIKRNNNSPSYGELLPWIIKDLLDIPNEQTHEIAKTWLAIYLYVILIDDLIDGDVTYSPHKTLLGASLASIGFYNLGKILKGTKYEDQIGTILSESMEFQSLTTEANRIKLNLPDKLTVAKQKNRIALACVVAFSSIYEEKHQAITKIINDLLIAIQFIDDLTDLEKDYVERAESVLLDEVLKIDQQLSKNQILEELMLNGALLRVLRKMETCFKNALNTINSELGADNQSDACNLFIGLQSQIFGLIEFVELAKYDYTTLNMEERKERILILEKKIKIVAQST